MNKDEVIRMDGDEAIIFLRGHKAFKCKKVRYWEYRLGKNIETTTIEEYNPEINHFIKPIEEKINSKLPTFEEFLRGRREKI